MFAYTLILAADMRFENLMVSMRTPFFLSVFNLITLLGNTIVVIAIAGIILIFLWRSKRAKAYGAGLATAVIGASGTGYVLKEIVRRARPGGLIPSTIETSFSFPSGHATLAMALYGFLAFVFCKLYPRHSAIIITLATLVILVVGFSRLYLGVHFPSDVYAGYLLGGLWLFIGIGVTKRMMRGVVTRTAERQ